MRSRQTQPGVSTTHGQRHAEGQQEIGVQPARTSGGGKIVTMTSTEAQNGFGRVLDAVAEGGTVRIRKHNVTRAVVISAERYDALTRTESSTLDELTAEFDDLLARMQTPQAHAGMQAAFDAAPDALGAAAVAAATRSNG